MYLTKKEGKNISIKMQVLKINEINIKLRVV